MFKMEKIRGYLFGAAIGLVVGTALYFVQPVKWKGQALVKIGQIAENPNINNYIEPIETVIERLKSSSFIHAVAKRANNTDIEDLLSVEKKAGLTIKQIRNADAIVITVVGGSAELVQSSIDAIVAELVSKHHAIVNAYQADALRELARIDAEQVELSKKLMKTLADDSNSNSEKGMVIGFRIMSLQSELETKFNQSMELRQSISSAKIHPSSQIETVSLSERRIFSSLWRASLSGLLTGLFLAVLGMQWRQKAIQTFSN